MVETDEEMDVCQNCGKRWRTEELKAIDDFFDRVQTGELMPSGECPECGCLCYPESCGIVVVEVDGGLVEVGSSVSGLRVMVLDFDVIVQPHERPYHDSIQIDGRRVPAREFTSGGELGARLEDALRGKIRGE